MKTAESPFEINWPLILIICVFCPKIRLDNDFKTIAETTNFMNGANIADIDAISADIVDNTNVITQNSANIAAISDDIAKLNAGTPQ